MGFRCRRSSPANAARLRSIGDCVPKKMIFRGGCQNRVPLTAKTPVELSWREQQAHFRLTAGSQQGQSIEGAGQSALLDEFAAALAKPAGQLQARIFEGAHIGQALTR